MMESQTKGLLLVVAAAVIWGTVGIMTRFAGNVDAATIAFYRFFFGAITIFSIIMLSRRLSEIVPKGKIFYLILLGIAVTLTVGFLTLSIKVSTIANALLLQYTAPIFAVVLSKIFLKEKIKKESFISLALCLAGIIFIFGDGFRTNLWLGSVFGLISGIAYASGMTLGRYLKEYSGLISTFWMVSLAAIFISPFAKPFSVTGDKIFILILFGIVQTALAPVLFLEGIRYVRTQDAGIVSMLDPMTNIILAAIIFSETPTIATFLGGAMILSAVVFQIISVKASRQS